MMYKDPDADPEELNQDFCRLRDVRKTLWRQQNIKEFHARLLQRKHGGTIIEMTDAESDSATATSDDDNYYNHPKEL